MNDIFNNESLINTFAHICNWARKLTSVQVDTGIRKEELWQTGNSCLRLVETLMKHEETEFMVAPVLEHYFNMMRPAIVLPLDKILSGTCEELDECRKFIKDLAEHPVRTLWEGRAENFRKVAESAGYTFDKTDYRDLPTIAPIIADAVTTFEYYLARNILQLREGRPSMQQPILLNDIAVFSSIAEAVQTLERIPAPAFIGFFGIEQTYGMTDDAFDAYRFGCSTRKKNITYNNRMTEEEYQTTPDPHSRKLYCVVRDGENIWIFLPRVEMTNDTIYGDSGFINYYGQRSSWAPIQVFFDSTAPAKEGTTALVPYRKKLWSLKDILDEEQKVWLPIFFTVVRAKFFGTTPVEAEPAMCIEETQVTMQLPDGNQPTNLPAIIKNNLQVPTAEDLFSRDENPAEYIEGDRQANLRHHGALTMMRWLNITSEDIADAPLAFASAISTKDAQKEIDRRTVLAYYKVIKKRVDANWLAPTCEAQQWYHNYIATHLDQILDDVKSGRLKSCAENIVDKQPVYNEDGTPKMYQPYSWSNAWEPLIAKTDIDDGKQIRRYGLSKDIYEYRDWFPSTLMDKRPPVTVRLYPNSPEEVAQICHCTVDDLPEVIRYMDLMQAFGDRRTYGNYRITINFSRPEAKKRGLITK